MEICNHKTMTFAIAFVLLLTMIFSLVTLPIAKAHDPPWEIPTFAYINASPNPVGVGQEVLIVVWVNRVIAGASVTNDIRFTDYKLTITKPDATTETITWDIVVDTTSSAYTQYAPNQVGDYSLKFEFPGQTYTWSGSYQNDIYLPSSATTTLKVQQDPIEKLPDTPLPTEYWKRPIEGQNLLWGEISSNWLGGAAISDRWQKDGSAPKSAHIMWTRILELGGLVGGTTNQDATFYSGFSYEDRFGRRDGGTPLILGGMLYYPLPLSHAGSRYNGYIAVDLLTGEELWYRGDILPRFGQLYDFESPNQHGVVGGILWQTIGSTWRGFDALYGKNIFNLTGVPSGTEVYTEKGEIVRYRLNYANRWLALWNNSAAISHHSQTYGSEGWRPVGETIDASTSDAYTWNVTIPDLPGSSSPSIVGVIPGDLILGRSSNVGLTSQSRGTDNPWTMWALSDKPGSRGQLLWIKNYPAPAGNITRMLAWQPIDPVVRTFTMTDFETGQRLGYSLDTGELLWGPLGDFQAFNYYSSRKGFAAYGNLYVSGYGGEILCFSMKNGTLLWKYNNTDSGIETPWGRYPLQAAAVADGVIYAYAGEHSPNTPLYKGYRVYAVDAFTGEELWTLLAWSSSGLGTSLAPIAIADGYLVHANAYDGRVYCIGKGPSATTVMASPKVAMHGSSVLVEGTVMDIAAGTGQPEQAGRFPHGVPAVSDESMTAWMEYVYMQKPKPADVIGVEVQIDVVDANGNYRNIGTATSDSRGFFSYQWTPDIPGKYTVIASFAGSESYYGSSAETAFAVDEAPEASPTPEPIQLPPLDMYILYATVVIVAAIAIVGVLLLLKKR